MIRGHRHSQAGGRHKEGGSYSGETPLPIQSLYQFTILSGLPEKGQKTIMDEIVRTDVYTFLSDERVNVDLIFDWQEDRGLLINCRLRPWKNSVNDGKMILAAGLTADDALLNAVRGGLNNRWIPLMWNRRAREIGIERAITPAIVPIHTGRAATLAQELFEEPDEYNHAQDHQNGAQKGSQAHSKQKKLVQSDLPGIS